MIFQFYVVIVLVSRKIREEVIPRNIVTMTVNCTVPPYHTVLCTYNNKFLRNVTTGCANPGCCVGAATHTHASGGGHCHTGSGSCHTHSGGTGVPSGTEAQSAGGFAVVTPRYHTHNYTSLATAPSVTTSCNGAHTHDAVNNDPLNHSIKLLQKSSIVNSIRERTFYQDNIFLWPKNLACLDNAFSKVSAFNTRIPKVVLNCCTSPGTNSGCANHTHACANHTHTVTLASHSHTLTTTCSTAGTAGQTSGCPKVAMATGHSHAVGSGSLSSVAGCNTSPSDGHTHGSLSLTPSSVETAFVKQSSIKIRNPGIEKNFMVFWACSNATIPVNLQIADGTNCTNNYLSKFPIGIPTCCTNPGTTVGSDTHTHACDSHTHTATLINHQHVASGSTASNTASQVFSQFNVTGPTTHTHAFNNPGNTGPSPTLCSSGSHTHGSQCSIPASKSIGIIQRL